MLTREWRQNYGSVREGSFDLSPWNYKLNSYNQSRISRLTHKYFLEICTLEHLKVGELGKLEEGREKSRNGYWPGAHWGREGGIRLLHARSVAPNIHPWMIIIYYGWTQWSIYRGRDQNTEAWQLCSSSHHCQAENKATESDNLLLTS